MKSKELEKENFQRICYINWALAPLLLIFFAWPYITLSDILHIPINLSFVGASLFALPLVFTLLHGHVTIAVGSLHRHIYYKWLMDNKYSYGLGFHPLIVTTRFRITLLSASAIFLLIALLITRGL